MQSFTFDEAMMILALESNGWQNVWDIYWIRKDHAGERWVGLSTDDAFKTLLAEKKLIRKKAPVESPLESEKALD